jgi:hypothetical protein
MLKFVLFALLVLLILHVGFWGTLGAILGAVLLGYPTISSRTEAMTFQFEIRPISVKDSEK